MIEPADPLDPKVRPLIEAHLAHSWESTPETSIHTMTPEDIARTDMRFWAIFDGDRAVACGALKPLEDGSVEVKSVHVAKAERGKGHARRIMAHLIDVARDQGHTAVVLETGSEVLPAFDAARALYERMGFAYCGPIPGYGPDENSAFMRLDL